jgi:2-polyprenyl-3-methyl-5-hydroxy-6-metoxy-1,4-benzoquinol methylase
VYAQYGTFAYGDLCKPDLLENNYDIINCVEGIEHIGKEFQQPVITAFYKALKPGGVLVISSPEAPNNVSGPSATNPWHTWELTKQDFLDLLYTSFSPENVELVTRKWTLPNGKVSNHFYCVCHKPV